MDDVVRIAIDRFDLFSENLALNIALKVNSTRVIVGILLMQFPKKILVLFAAK
jgi:hypothetical protein